MALFVTVTHLLKITGTIVRERWQSLGSSRVVSVDCVFLTLVGGGEGGEGNRARARANDQFVPTIASARISQGPKSSGRQVGSVLVYAPAYVCMYLVVFL